MSEHEATGYLRLNADQVTESRIVLPPSPFAGLDSLCERLGVPTFESDGQPFPPGDGPLIHIEGRRYVRLWPVLHALLDRLDAVGPPTATAPTTPFVAGEPLRPGDACTMRVSATGQALVYRRRDGDPPLGTVAGKYSTGEAVWFIGQEGGPWEKS